MTAIEMPTPSAPVLIGMALEEAAEAIFLRATDPDCLPPIFWSIRIVRRDGMWIPVVRNYDTTRINVEVEENIIVSQTVG